MRLATAGVHLFLAFTLGVFSSGIGITLRHCSLSGATAVALFGPVLSACPQPAQTATKFASRSLAAQPDCCKPAPETPEASCCAKQTQAAKHGAVADACTCCRLHWAYFQLSPLSGQAHPVAVAMCSAFISLGYSEIDFKVGLSRGNALLGAKAYHPPPQVPMPTARWLATYQQYRI